MKVFNGYFGIGIYHTKCDLNIGTLWRHALSFGASYIFTIGKRYKKQASDTQKATLKIPLFHYSDMEDFKKHSPHSCLIVGVEIAEKAESLHEFHHPYQCNYLLGAEDHGLSVNVLNDCHRVVQIKQARSCLNVAGAGTIIMYDRAVQFSNTRASLNETH